MTKTKRTAKKEKLEGYLKNQAPSSLKKHLKINL
jgi:hypothetical protein